MFRKHPLEQQAVEIAEQVRGKLTRMGFRHRTKYRDYDELYQVEFSQVEASPQFVKLRVDVDQLPEGVTTAKLKDETTLNDLGHTLGYLVTFEDREKKAGCWFVVHLTENNGIPRYVPFKEFVASYPAHPAPMTIPIGQGLGGPVWRDLRTMPHLLVAGATGKGKSVMVHAMLATLLHLPPGRLRVMLADLKGGMTLGKYKRIPHLSREHYVNRAVDLPLVLLALQTEMQRRAEAMENVAEDIDEWNRTRAQKWPYILLVIEELANAMLSKERIKLPNNPKEKVADATERLLADLAARARATGIHIVATTQTPRSDVISGIIKANFPCRIAFGTASDMDSRVIIDDSRAQGLAPGRMAFLDCADIYELQAPLLSEDDRALILKKTLAGEHWLISRTAEDRMVEDIRLLLAIADRDFRGILDIERLYRAPDIHQMRMPPDRIRECLAVLVADGVVTKIFLSRNYRIAVENRFWQEKYCIRPLVLDDWDAVKPREEDEVIEGEVIQPGTTREPPKQLSEPLGNQYGVKLVPKHSNATEPDLPTDIRRWRDFGYTRNQMVERLGLRREDALKLIASVLGPARKEASCSVPSSAHSPVVTVDH
jgi:hypothetical protein